MAPVLSPAPSQEESLEDSEEYARYLAAADRIEEEKRQALAERGPSWKEWWYYSASKWYLVLGFLILDVWVVGSFTEASLWLAVPPSVVLVVYGEFLLYQYLYRRPAPGEGRSRGPFRRTWLRPVQFGRWTPEAATIRAGGTPPGAAEGPRPEEFL